MREVFYGRTPLGQLLYDLLFTRLSPGYLARKHHKPVAEIRRLRTAAVTAFRYKRKTNNKTSKTKLK